MSIGVDGIPRVTRDEWLMDERHGLVQVGGWRANEWMLAGRAKKASEGKQ